MSHWALISKFTRNALGFLAVLSFMVPSLSSSLLAPNFAIAVAHLRPEQIGNLFAPYAILLLVFSTIGGAILVRTVGSPVALIVGFGCLAPSSRLGTFLTILWSVPVKASSSFFTTIAKLITCLAAVTTIFVNVNPVRATTMVTWIRQREQLPFGPDRTAFHRRTLHLNAATRSLSAESALQRAADVQADIDEFRIAFYAVIVGLLVVALDGAVAHPSADQASTVNSGTTPSWRLWGGAAMVWDARPFSA